EYGHSPVDFCRDFFHDTFPELASMQKMKCSPAISPIAKSRLLMRIGLEKPMPTCAVHNRFSPSLGQFQDQVGSVALPSWAEPASRLGVVPSRFGPRHCGQSSGAISWDSAFTGAGWPPASCFGVVSGPDLRSPTTAML